MRASKTRAFYIETLVLTFILLFVLSILMRVFGAAGEESLNARRKTRAAVIAQNVVSEFQGGAEGFIDAERKLISSADDEDEESAVPTETFTISYDEGGLQAADGRYLADVQLAREERPVGYMLTMTGSITYAGHDEILAYIDSAKYIADNDSDYLTGGSDLELDEETGEDTGEKDLSGEEISADGGYEEDDTEEDQTDETEPELTRITETEAKG